VIKYSEFHKLARVGGNATVKERAKKGTLVHTRVSAITQNILG